MELPILSNEPVDIVLVCFFRPILAQRTILAIMQNTRWPFNLIIEDNTPFVNDPIEKKLSAGMNRGFKKVTSRHVVLTCDDVLPPFYPVGTPCWLERLVKISTANPHYGGINCRFQRMANYHFDDNLYNTSSTALSMPSMGAIYEPHEYNKPQVILPHTRSLSNVFRISWSEDLRRIGKITGHCVPGMTRKYESSGFTTDMFGRLKKLTGCAAHIHCNHLGHQETNKGYPENVPFEFDKMPGKAYGEVDPVTHVPIGHVCPKFDWNDLESLRVDSIEEIQRVLEESSKVI